MAVTGNTAIMPDETILIKNSTRFYKIAKRFALSAYQRNDYYNVNHRGNFHKEKFSLLLVSIT